MIHHVEIKSIDKMNLYEGIVKFAIQENEYKAFFYRDEFKQGEITKVEFDHLEYPLEWDVIFSENKNKELRIEKVNNSEWIYYCYGKITAIEPVIADFGDIRLELGNWTNDPYVIGEYIYWKIERLDIGRIK
jgi:hypothetical protein